MRLRPVTPLSKRPIVDGLAFLLSWDCGLVGDPRTTFERVRLRIQNEIGHSVCEPAFLTGSRYRISFRIPLAGKTKALVQVGARDPQRQKGEIRVEVNPSKFEPGDVDYFHEVMGRIFGPAYRGLLRHALLQRIDFAVDIVHADLSRMLVSYSNAHRFTVFGKLMSIGGHVETYNFGSVTSDYMTTVYDKRVEQVHQAAIEIARKGLGKEPLKANMIKQLKKLRDVPPTVRVEVRGAQLRNMPLHQLESQENRFKRFKFAYLGDSDGTLPAWIEASFLSLCRDKGVKAALATLKNTEHGRAINAFWKSRRCSWWQPESMWAEACAALRETGLFPTQAFAPDYASDVEENRQLPDIAIRIAGRTERAGAPATLKSKLLGATRQSSIRI